MHNFKFKFRTGATAFAVALVSLTALSSCSVAAPEVSADYDQYGGWKGLQGKSTGFFHTQKLDGKWWIITPEGHVFWSKGVNAIQYTGEKSKLDDTPYLKATEPKYGNAENFARQITDKLHGWGFNTAASWSDKEFEKTGIAYTQFLNMSAALKKRIWYDRGFPDVFDPRFAESVDEVAQRLCAPRKDDKFLLGYYPDNELNWGHNHIPKRTLLNYFLKEAEGSPGRLRAEAFLKERNLTAQSAKLGDAAAFQAECAKLYFQITDAAIRKADPNHMNLGCRFVSRAEPAAIPAMKGHVDIVTINAYSMMPPTDKMEEASKGVDAPVMITEYSFLAKDSGLPNNRQRSVQVANQKARAAALGRWLSAAANTPYCVGQHWFKYSDQPKEGRKSDGEANNFGLVNIKDEPYTEVVETFSKFNIGLEERRAKK